MMVHLASQHLPQFELQVVIGIFQTVSRDVDGDGNGGGDEDRKNSI